MIKERAYDSFGNTTGDTLPQFFFPLGFAGGLVDPYTGFIRFGFRDDNPATGRFTAKDPLGDTGGDHDLYDYCVDDPVSALDSSGLFTEFIAKRIGAYLGGGSFVSHVLFPDPLNEPEVVIDLAKKKADIDKKIQDGEATKKDMQNYARNIQTYLRADFIVAILPSPWNSEGRLIKAAKYVRIIGNCFIQIFSRNYRWNFFGLLPGTAYSSIFLGGSLIRHRGGIHDYVLAGSF